MYKVWIPRQRLSRILGATVAVSSLFVMGGQSVAHAATGTVSGQVTAGGQPVPSGSVQVVFVKYNKAPSNNCTSRPTSNALVSTTVGANGNYSVDLDTSFAYKIIYKPLTTAPRNALFRWYINSSSAGTTTGYHNNATIPQATCINNLTSSGLANVNLATNGESIQLTGTISTASGAPTSNATLALTPTTNCYFMQAQGSVASPNEAGAWEMAGVETNQSQMYIQVYSPASQCNTTFFAKKTEAGYELIPYADVSACGDACKFNLTDADIPDVNLRLPITGRITGTVSGPNGPVGERAVCVTAFRDGATAMNYWSGSSGTACTNAAGTYTLDVTYDTYRLQFVAQQGSPYITEWHDNVSNSSGYTGSTPVCLKTTGTGCSTTKTVDADLDGGKSISGRVTDNNGNPVVGANVNAMKFESTWGGFSNSSYAITDSNGNYSVNGLLNGNYTVFARHPDHGEVWLGGSRESATRFDVTESVSGKDLTFPRGFKAGGQLTIGAGSEARICVSALLVKENMMGWGEYVNGDCFTAPGKWQLKGLRPGNYRFRFQAQSGDLRSTFAGSTNFDDATTFTLTNTDLPAIDMLIPAGKTITGKVGSDGIALPDVCVSAFKVNSVDWGWGTWAGSACTSTTGIFSIKGLEDGDYRLRVEPRNDSDFGPGFYSASGTPVRNHVDASLITVGGTDRTVTVTSQSLQSSPKFTATVVDNGTPVQGICVNAIRKVNDSGWGEFGASSCSGVDGRISLRGLAPGDYRFEVNPYVGDYRRGWFRDGNMTTTDITQATVKTLALVDVPLGSIALATGTNATGKVTDGTNGIPACVQALRDDGTTWGQYAGGACSNNSGDFTIRGLDPSASYWFRVDVWAGDFRQGFVKSDGTVAATTTGIASLSDPSFRNLGTITLVKAPFIKGTVTSGVSTKEPNVCVNAHDSSTLQWVTSSCSGPTGAFSLRGLNENTDYKLYIWTQNAKLTGGWYKSATADGFTQTGSSNDASSVTVGSEGVTGLAVRLANAGTISGLLPDGFCVAAWTTPGSASATRQDASAVSCASKDGKYELKGLTPSTSSQKYYLQVFRLDGTAVTQTSPTTEQAVDTATTVNITAS